MSELIERARAAAQHSREYGPGTNAPLLDELAAALEAAREYVAEADRRVGEQFNKAQRSEAYALEKAAETLTLTKELEAAREDACVALVADIRFACGDNGKRMQPELVEFIRELAEDAERWRALREMDGGAIYALLGGCDGIHPEQADAAIDQARGKGGQEVEGGR